MPWNMPVTAFGSPTVDLRLLAAEIGQRHEQAGETTPIGCRRPRKATMIAVKP